jgi:hypothetical protein
VADWATISSAATAAGTLVLAVATFSSIRSANRSARVAERALMAGQRPILIPSLEADPLERVRFIDEVILQVPGHAGIAKQKHENLYFAMGVRNGGAGVAVIHGWRVEVDEERRRLRPSEDDFRRQSRDMFIPAGIAGYWQGAIRDSADPDYTTVRAVIDAGERVFVDVLYGDHDGGQRAIARFSVPSQKTEELGARIDVIRYWNVDGDDPRNTE